jgi:hypothetical protein
MRYLKILGTALVAMLLFGIVATSALTFPLPDAHALATFEYPLHLQFADNGKTNANLNDVAGNRLEGKGLLVLFLLKDLSSLGEFEALFLNVVKVNKTGNVPCNSVSDKKGEVLLTGIFHIVPLNTSKKEEDGIDFEFNAFEIECGPTKVKIEGSVISTVNYKGVKENEDFTELCGRLGGNGKGINNITEYIEDNGLKVKDVLLVDFGNGLKQASLEIGEEVCGKTLKGMFSILTR